MTRIRINDFSDKVIAQKDESVAQGLYKGISHILNTGNNIAPKDEGTLIQTSDVDVDPVAGEASAFYVTKYARRLHENPQYNFQGGRQGKWLERAVLSEGDRVRDIIAAELKDRLG